MTDEERQGKMDFIIEHQAKHEIEIQGLLVVVNKLTEGQQVLTSAVTTLALQMDADHQEMRNSAAAANARLNRFEQQADLERQEMRVSVARLDAQAERDRQAMAATVDKLVETIANVHRRVSRLEDQSSPL